MNLSSQDDKRFHQQFLQLMGIAVPDLENYFDIKGIKMFREFRIQFSDSEADFDWVSLKIPANPSCESPYSFFDNKLYHEDRLLMFPGITIGRVPLPKEESDWHLKGYTFPFRGSRNPYKEMRMNLKISGRCPGHCFFCHRTHSYRIKPRTSYFYKPDEVLAQVKLAEGEHVLDKVSRVIFISELYGSETQFLDVMQDVSVALKKHGYSHDKELICCATEVRSLDGLKRLRDVVNPARYSFSLEFFHNREEWMGHYKGISMPSVYTVLENARRAGFTEIQLNYMAGIDSLDECAQGFSKLVQYGLVDSVGLSTFTIFAEDEFQFRHKSAWDVQYYQQVVEILNHCNIKAYHPDSFDMRCPYTEFMEKIL
jgi:hypothetical protein